MRNTILKHAWRAFGHAYFVPQSRGAIVMAALLLATTNLFATATVSLLSGGPNPSLKIASAGYLDGDITTNAEYNTPCGIAADLSGNYLFVADGGSTNNAIRVLEFDINYTFTLLTLTPDGLNLATNLFNHPVGVAIDSDYNLFVLNRGNGSNGNVLEFFLDEDLFATLVATNAANLTNAAGLALDFNDNIYVTIKSNKVLEITSPGVSNVVATVTNAGANLQGLVVKYNGLLAVCDSGRNGIYLINPTNGVVSTNAGFHGAGDYYSTLNHDPISVARFSQPSGVAETGDGNLIVTDFGNHRVKVVTSTSVTNLYGIKSNYWYGPYPGLTTGAGTVKVPDNNYNDVQSRLPFGVVIAPDGSVYVTEKYWSVIRKVTDNIKPPLYPPLAPENLAATAGYGMVILTWTASASPSVTNYNIKRSTTSGGPYTNNIIGTTSGTTYTDTNVVDGTNYYYVVSSVSSTVGEGINSSEASATPMKSPVPTILSVTATPVTPTYGLVSLTWSASAGATSYNVKRSTSTNGATFSIIGSSTTTSYNDTTVINGTTYYYVVSAVNPGGESGNSLEVSATSPLPPVPDPQIGYVDFPLGVYPFYTSVFHPVSSADFYNDTLIVIKGTVGSGTHYTYGYTTNASDVPDPTIGDASIPSDYADGFTTVAEVMPYVVPQEAPYLIIKAIGTEQNHPDSAVVQAAFRFITGNPNINGNNAAQFTISDITINAHLYYTLDGSDPSSTNPAAIDLGTVAPLTNGIGSTTNVWTVSFTIQTNTMFKVRAFRDNYQPSAIVTNIFSTTNYVPNTISFGFAAGEASSDFIASPGQLFYAPVTLLPLSATEIYSLQFNLTVTNAGPNPGPAIIPGTFGFESMLVKPDTNTGYYLTIPTYMFAGWYTNPIPPGQLVIYEGTNFVNLATTDLSLNLLGVGWLERYGQTNLYDTVSQDLIQFSMAHDTVFLQDNGKIILGGYNFSVPVNAAPGQTYQIQIGRPSATADGIGMPGSSVFIYAPTNGSPTNGAINSIKTVTMGQRKYLVGNVYPFRWFNAGDFGNTNLQNADVEQVFQSAIYGLNYPPYGSDFFDGMDSCGNIGTLDGQTGYYTNNNAYPYLFPYTITNWTYTYDVNSNLLATTDNILSLIRYIYIDTTFFSAIYTNTYIYPSSTNITLGTATYYPPANVYVPNLFDGNDQNINQIAFGDGVLDVCDVYVTYRRSLDSSLTWFRRFWTNGVRVAETTPNLFTSGAASKASSVVSKMVKSAMSGAGSTSSVTNQPKIIFTAGDCQTNAGSTIQIPITASIFGNYPLRILMLNLTVVPLDGSPALTTPVAFSYNSALGSPWTTDQRGNGNYSAVWLNSSIAGLTGNVSIGTLTVTLPANATSLSAYAVHFDHASASPNGLASFPKQARTGLITFSNRSGSSYNDGIPDSWRLRYFLTLNNLLSQTNADADGDGMNNLQEYLAGTDPTDPTSFFKNIGNDRGAAQQPQDCVISWPSAIGKQYVIQRSPSLSTPFWTSVGTNSGNGTIMEFHDTAGGGIRYYRVYVQ